MNHGHYVAAPQCALVLIIPVVISYVVARNPL